jgi:hypothetical protein
MMARSSALGACGVLRLLVVVAAVIWSPAARAQATSWLYVGGGAGVFDAGDRESRPALQLDTGLGTSAEHALVAGGIFRLQGYLDQGVDIAGALRLVTRGFAIGGFGIGVDAGVYQRFWGPGSTGFNGDVVLGAPWGLTLLGGASVGSGDQRVYFVSLGVDFARLTVHRNTGLDWFANPMRAPEQ